jgi:hypothetical protein
MKLFAYLAGLIVAGLGVLGVISPKRVVPFARMFQSQAGLNTAAALRLVLGTSFFRCALTSRIPRFMRVLGVATVISGVITPFFGVKRLGRILDWWEGKGSSFSRVWSMFALGLGIFLTWALTPDR